MNKNKQSQNQAQPVSQKQNVLKAWIKTDWVHPKLNELPKHHHKVHNYHYKLRSQAYKEAENNEWMVDSIPKIEANAKLAQRVR